MIRTKLDNKPASQPASQPADLESSKIRKKTPEVNSSGVFGDPKSSRKLIKSRERVKKHGEVFTPENIVREMCDLAEPDLSDPAKKVLEPAAGDGNFLVEILQRKLAKVKENFAKNPMVADLEFAVLAAVANIYSVDIMPDNVREARKRMRGIVFDIFAKMKNSEDFLMALDEILQVNIVRGNSLTKKMWTEISQNGQTLWGAEDTLKFYDFVPDFREKTFAITEYSYLEIERIAQSSRTATMTDFREKMHELKTDGIHEKNFAKKSAKTKPKKISRKSEPKNLIFELLNKEEK